MLESALLCLVGRQALYDRDYERVAKAFAQAYRKNSLVVLWSPEPRAATMVAMESLYQNTLLSPKVRADALFVHANLKFALGDYPGGIQEVRLAIHLLPNDAEFYATLGCIYAMQWKAAAALAAFEQCRNLGCDDVEHTLFHRGILSIKDSDMLLLLEEYVKRAEPDGRKLPEACYRLAILYGFKGPAYLGKARRFYDMGQTADKNRLPVFRDESSQHRIRARTLLKRYKPCGNPQCDQVGTMDCSSCHTVAYCSSDCQRKHWKVHKKTCRHQRREPV